MLVGKYISSTLYTEDQYANYKYVYVWSTCMLCAVLGAFYASLCILWILHVSENVFPRNTNWNSGLHEVWFWIILSTMSPGTFLVPLLSVKILILIKVNTISSLAQNIRSVRGQYRLEISSRCCQRTGTVASWLAGWYNNQTVFCPCVPLRLN